MVITSIFFLLDFSPTVVSAFYTGEAASIVLGQPNFSSTIAGQDSQTGIYAPSDVAADPSGNVWVLDYQNNRVLEFTSPF